MNNQPITFANYLKGGASEETLVNMLIKEPNTHIPALLNVSVRIPILNFDPAVDEYQVTSLLYALHKRYYLVATLLHARGLSLTATEQDRLIEYCMLFNSGDMMEHCLKVGLLEPTTYVINQLIICARLDEEQRTQELLLEYKDTFWLKNHETISVIYCALDTTARLGQKNVSTVLQDFISANANFFNATLVNDILQRKDYFECPAILITVAVKCNQELMAIEFMKRSSVKVDLAKKVSKTQTLGQLMRAKSMGTLFERCRQGSELVSTEEYQVQSDRRPTRRSARLQTVYRKRSRSRSQDEGDIELSFDSPSKMKR